MKGTVEFFNNTKRLGFIRGKDGVRYFVHESEVGNDFELEMEDIVFRTLLPGWEAEFTPAKDGKGRDQAKNVEPIGDVSGIEVRKGRVLGPHVTDGYAEAIIAQDGSITLSCGIKPKLEAQDMLYAFPIGKLFLKGFHINLPVPSPKQAYVLLDPQKNPRSSFSERYERVNAGSYLVRVEASGLVSVWNVGWREGRGIGESNWIIFDLRFRHQYKLFSEPVSEVEILKQTPTSGLERDNDGFIAGIIRGITLMKGAIGAPAAK